jgi:diguanylate cyclase (GGDEF)-like protein
MTGRPEPQGAGGARTQMASPQHKPGSKAGATAHLALLVILVGRTGLDGRLRLDPGVEIARVRTPLEAVGELSEDVDPGVTRVVIVAADADPARSNGRDDAGAARDFIAALRLVDPHVRVLRLEAEDGEAPIRAGYDGVIEADAGPEILRTMLNSGRTDARNGAAASREADASSEMPAAPKLEPIPAPKPAPPAAPPAAPPEPLPDIPAKPIPVFPPAHEPAEPEEEPEDPDEMPEVPKPQIRPAMTIRSAIDASEVAPEPIPAAMSQVGDEVLTRLLLQGRDLTDAALELLRSKAGGREVVFTTSGRTGREGRREADDRNGTEVSVSWRGRQFGRLHSGELGLEELTPLASWLGSWLALRDQHAQLRDAAFTDPLTGAYNRRFFDHFLAAAIEQAREQRRSMTVLMFDIDDFKIYNDRYGHAAGDEILTETVKLLQSVIRPSDKVCRIGGDEFVVIFHEPQGPRKPGSKLPSDIFEIAQRFQKAICTHNFPKLGREAPGTLTISGGMACYPWDGATAEALLEYADQLALRSKQQGKNAVTLGPGAEREHGCSSGS